MSERNRAEPVKNVENRLRNLRLSKGLSQGTLADMAGITRQAIYAIEANQYLPTTAVALRLASGLGCRVEDLFSLVASGESVEGDLVGMVVGSPTSAPLRVKVARVGERVIVRPVAALGGVLNFTVAADGLLTHAGAGPRRLPRQGERVQVKLLRDRRVVEQQIFIAGCDPAILLAGEYLRRRHSGAAVVGLTMGSAAAVEALKRQEVHIAGLHVVDTSSGERNLPYLRRHLRGQDVTVVTFASWEQGLMVKVGNPKGILDVADLVRKDVVLVNREEGSGARLLLDHRLAIATVRPKQIRGYSQIVGSHLDVGRLIAQGQADVGMGMRSVAWLLGLDFVPLQEDRYDLVICTKFLTAHPGLSALLDTIASRSFRTEIEALGGYDTRDAGKIQNLREAGTTWRG